MAKRHIRRGPPLVFRSRKKFPTPPDICNAPGVGNRRCWLDAPHKGPHQDDSSKPWKMPKLRGKRYRVSKKSRLLAKRRREHGVVALEKKTCHHCGHEHYRVPKSKMCFSCGGSMAFRHKGAVRKLARRK